MPQSAMQSFDNLSGPEIEELNRLLAASQPGIRHSGAATSFGGARS